MRHRLQGITTMPLLLLLLAFVSHDTLAFTARSGSGGGGTLPTSTFSIQHSSSSSLGMGEIGSAWETIVKKDNEGNENGIAFKTVLKASEDAAAASPSQGSKVTIKYSGSLWMTNSDENNAPPLPVGCSIDSWDTEAVLECWLCHQQGLYDVLSGPFREHSVSGATLLDEAVFDEDFVTTTLGVANKIQAKKTLMAVRRLRTTCDEFEHGKVFDAKNDDNESYDFILGGGKTIQAMDRLVSTMVVGETSRVVARCDAAYGADGCRSVKGDVLVPPFCGLAFDVTLLSIE